MKYKNKINQNLAYFIGVIHSDGCFYKFKDKIKKRIQIRLILYVGEKSIPMSIKFKKILFEQFDRNVNIRKVPNKESYVIQTSINKLWPIFKNWNKNIIPPQIKKESNLFGAYLAGLIDGDGHIKIKKNENSRTIPQHVIKIASDRKLKELKKLIELHFNCSVHFENDKRSKAFNTCFYISKKNIKMIMKNTFPHLVLQHKKQRIKNYNEKIRARPDFRKE